MAKYTQIQKGDKSENTSTLQTMLNGLGYNLDVDGSFGGKTQAAVIDYQTKNGLKVDGIVGDETWGSLYSTQNAASQTTSATGTTSTSPIGSYADAQQNYNNVLASKPADQENPFDQQIQDIYNQIVNREPFSYDMNADAFYQQYKDQYVQQGQMAMMDTMGQAAGLTGGYGSSYSQQAGQQAYNQYLQGLNDVLPELEQRAYDRYTDEENALLQQYSMLQGERDYVDEKNLDAYNKWLTELSLAEGERDFLYDVEQDEYAKQQDALALQQSEAADTYNKALALFNAGVDTPEIREAIGIPEDYTFPVGSDDDVTWEYSGLKDSDGNLIYYGSDGSERVFAPGYGPAGIYSTGSDVSDQVGQSGGVSPAAAMIYDQYVMGNKKQDEAVAAAVYGTDVDYDSVLALGLGDITEEELMNLIDQGMVEEYTQEGVLKFRLTDLGNLVYKTHQTGLSEREKAVYNKWAPSLP